jgi:hypothetical protein
METLLSKYWLLVAGIWYAGNGILHDIFVIINHKTKYDRELLRLLMDGHLLILSGIIMFVSYLMVQKGMPYGAWTGIITAISMLVYCMMIFPFLKSIGTIAITIIALIVCIRLCVVQ